MRKLAAICTLSLVVLAAATSLVAAREKASVARVIDGDTVELRSGEKVRLIGVDAPEAGQRLGDAATTYARAHLDGELVWLEYDTERHDRYGRVLAYVFLDDGTFFNLKIIKKGYARAYTKYPFKAEYMASFLEAERQARDSKLGVWADEALAPAEAVTAKYWLNTGSGTLHNASCRWYGATKAGRYTNETAGRDCGICGGARRVVTRTTTGSSGGKYWINSSSNVRHNSRCRWYGNTKRGYYTSERTGRACGTCGG